MSNKDLEGNRPQERKPLDTSEDPTTQVPAGVDCRAFLTRIAMISSMSVAGEMKAKYKATRKVGLTDSLGFAIQQSVIKNGNGSEQSYGAG